MKESIFINENALTASLLFSGIKVYFLILTVNFLRLWAIFWSFFFNIKIIVNLI